MLRVRRRGRLGGAAWYAHSNQVTPTAEPCSSCGASLDEFWPTEDTRRQLEAPGPSSVICFTHWPLGTREKHAASAQSSIFWMGGPQKLHEANVLCPMTQCHTLGCLQMAGQLGHRRQLLQSGTLPGLYVEAFVPYGNSSKVHCCAHCLVKMHPRSHPEHSHLFTPDPGLLSSGAALSCSDPDSGRLNPNQPFQRP